MPFDIEKQMFSHFYKAGATFIFIKQMSVVDSSGFYFRPGDLSILSGLYIFSNLFE